MAVTITAASAGVRRGSSSTLDDGSAAALLPAADGHVGSTVRPQPVVEAHGHPTREQRRRAPDQVRVLQGGGAEDDPGHAAVEQLVDVSLATHAAAGLHRDVDAPRRWPTRRPG